LSYIHLFFVLIWLLCIQTIADAQEVVLKVKGPGATPQRTFTEQDIRALPAVTISTLDPWEKKQRSYTGCTIMSLLEMLGVEDQINIVHVIARDEYNAKISLKELSRYQYLLTYEMDGKDYSEWGNSDKGPLAIAVKLEDVRKEDKVRVKNQLVLWIKEIVLK